MTHDEFTALLETHFQEMRHIGQGKGREYASTDDRLSNFKEIARTCGVSPITVLYIYMEKHMRSIASYVRHGQVFSNEPISGRIRDAQLYLSLLDALILDMEKEANPQQALDLRPTVGYGEYRTCVNCCAILFANEVNVCNACMPS